MYQKFMLFFLFACPCVGVGHIELLSPQDDCINPGYLYQMLGLEYQIMHAKWTDTKLYVYVVWECYPF